MSCEEARPWIHPYVDGELDLVRTVQIQGHLDTCSARAQARDQIEAVRAAVSNAATLRNRVPVELAARILRGIRTRKRFGVRRQPRASSAALLPAHITSPPATLRSTALGRAIVAACRGVG